MELPDILIYTQGGGGEQGRMVIYIVLHGNTKCLSYAL